MRLSEILVYPIKSLGGVNLNTSKVLESGLELDRRWLLIDDNNDFLSQRTVPKLATLSVEIREKSLFVFQKTNRTNGIEISFDADLGEEVETSIWDISSSSFVLPTSYNKWFSDFLGISARLVKMNPNAMRNRTLAVEPKKSKINYADGYPFLVLSKASVKHISNEIGQEIDIRQFRANLIVEDCEAYEEDSMNFFTIGDVEFNMVKPCKRCIVIGINQDTGKSSKQPIAYLAKTRTVENYILFGMNAALIKAGTIHTGDDVVK